MLQLSLKKGSRANPRIQIPAATSVIMHDIVVGKCHIKNLSAGGALLIGDFDIPVRSDIMLVLELSAYSSITLSARVTRTEKRPDGCTVTGVSFCNMGLDTEALLYDIILSHLSQKLEQLRPTVLVVDDCAEVRNALRRDLKALNRPVALAPMTLDAIRMLQDRSLSIDVAIVDLMLGVEDGMELLRYLKSHYPEIKRVLISGHVRPSQLELAQCIGNADLVLTKPWSREQIAAILTG